jgi:hypothetical protein
MDRQRNRSQSQGRLSFLLSLPAPGLAPMPGGTIAAEGRLA